MDWSIFMLGVDVKDKILSGRNVPFSEYNS